MPEANFVVVDVETTGLNPHYHHRIAEMAVVTVSPTGQVLDRWETLVNPQRDLGPQAIHGIRAAQILEAPTFSEIVPELAARFQGHVLVAHNLSFDAGFLRHEFDRAGVRLPELFLSGLCTMKLSHDYVFGNARSLAHCCEFLSIPTGVAHSAGDDAQAAAGLLARYLDLDPNRPDWEKHLGSARSVEWPSFPERTARRQVHRVDTTDDQPHFLARIATRMVEFTGADEDEEYLMLLDRAMLDRHLSHTEQQELVDLAAGLGIDRKRCMELHTYYLEQLIASAWADEVITPDEQAELFLVASVLGVPGRIVESGLAGKPTTAEVIPAGATYSYSVTAGDVIVLTGTMTRPREEFAIALQSLGYAVGDNVTKKTSLVVAADPDSLSGKAAKARKNGIPVVGEDFLFTGLGVPRS